MKKIVSMTMCLLLIASVFTACGSGKTTSPSASPSPAAGESAVSGAASPSPDGAMGSEGAASGTASGTESGTASGTASGAASGTNAALGLRDYRDTLKETYGEDYIPDREFTEEEISEKLGISNDLYDEIYAEGSTLDENPDTFIAVKAKSGKADEVEKLLNDYKEKLLSDNKFEANRDKINSAQVVKEGDHVFLFILGKNDFGDEIADVAEGFKNEIQKGVDALRNLFR